MNELIDFAFIAAVLLIVAAYWRGRHDGRVAGREEGVVDAIRQLLRAKDQECWTGARYLEVDTYMEAETERVSRRKP